MMKKSIISLLAPAALCLALAATSCQREFSSAGADNLQKESDGPVFIGTIDAFGTKTSLVDSTLCVEWHETDTVAINGVRYVAQPLPDNPRKAKFYRASEEESGAIKDPKNGYVAIFPASLCVKDPATGANVYELPKAISYNEGCFDMPMYAKGAGTDLVFQNICAVLKVSVSPSTVLDSLVVKADKALTGPFSVDALNGYQLVLERTSACDSVICRCPATQGTDFYIPVPAQDYKGTNLGVSLRKSDGEYEVMSTDRNASIVLSRNTIYPFNFRRNATMTIYESQPAVTKESGQL